MSYFTNYFSLNTVESSVRTVVAFYSVLSEIQSKIEKVFDSPRSIVVLQYTKKFLYYAHCGINKC